MESFWNAYEDKSKFGLFTNSRLTHQAPNRISLADDDMMGLLDRLHANEHANNTAIIFFGDHGARFPRFRSTLTGKLEERMPFLSISLPKWFRTVHPHLFANIKRNAEMLTSHYDLYPTLLHLVDLTETPPPVKVHTGHANSLFAKMDPVMRTCRSAGIENHWCPCLSYQLLNATQPVVKVAGEELVSQLNKLLCEDSETCSLCQQLTLDKVEQAWKKTANTQVQLFKDVKRDHRCDSCGVVYDWNKSGRERDTIELTLFVNPGGARFEATVEIEKQRIFVNNRHIQRIDEYGSEPRCIANKFPHLRQFCICRQTN